MVQSGSSRKVSRPVVRLLVADGSVVLVVTGSVGKRDLSRLVDALAEARDLCAGVVVLDVSGCETSGCAVVALVRSAAERTPHARCRVRVAAGARAVLAAVDDAGIARIKARHPSPG